MIDSVLKGTGNSRFLKSAVPAGTSWADALAMLQAGTFPIDFNGINAEGFQQVGTPLNKANLLKDATAAQIGLPPSTTPDGMFQALGNTGELHVWRKTVTTSQDIPAKYELESAKETLISTRAEYGSGTQRIIVEYASSCSVSESGDPYLVNSSSAILEATSSTTITSLNNLKGKFLKFSKDSSYQYVTVTDGIFFIPSDATFRLESGPYRIFADKAQKVTGYAKVPAGTTTTYPVSTNPNAYQEGNDAKPAGYVVGDVVTGQFLISDKDNVSTSVAWRFGDDVTVADDGSTSLKDPSGDALDASNYESSRYDNKFKGKFVSVTKNSVGKCSFDNGIVYFIPNDAIISKITLTSVTFGQQAVVVDRYQPVTGYPAIPAGTTIEYLGKLGDKARVQVVSYVGTGTYGADNPNSLTFNFVPKIVMIRCDGDTNFFDAIYGMRQVVTDLSTGYYVTVKWSKKTLSWYSDDGPRQQMNDPGDKYYAIAII